MSISILPFKDCFHKQQVLYTTCCWYTYIFKPLLLGATYWLQVSNWYRCACMCTVKYTHIGSYQKHFWSYPKVPCFCENQCLEFWLKQIASESLCRRFYFLKYVFAFYILFITGRFSDQSDPYLLIALKWVFWVYSTSSRPKLYIYICTSSIRFL